MTELKVYRWATYLVPGYVFLVVTCCFVLTEDSWKSLLQALNSIEDLVFFVLVSSLVSYVCGLLLWGTSYALGVRHLSPFLASSWRNLRSIREMFMKTRYHQLRCEEAWEFLGALPSAQDDHSPAIEGDRKVFGRERFRLTLFKVMERLPRALGPRIAGEWEHLGLLQSLMLVWLTSGFLLLVEWALDAGGLVAPRGFVPAITGYAGPLLIVVALVLTTGTSYRFRNLYLARDVALGYVILEEEQKKASED